MQALNLDFGVDYGRSWFSAASDSSAMDIAAKYDFQSCEELARLLLDPAAFRFIDVEIWKASAHYRTIIAKLAVIGPSTLLTKHEE